MSLRDLISEDELLLAPGIYDALSGLIASQSGAKAVYVSGASRASPGLVLLISAWSAFLK